MVCWLLYRLIHLCNSLTSHKISSALKLKRIDSIFLLWASNDIAILQAWRFLISRNATAILLISLAVPVCVLIRYAPQVFEATLGRILQPLDLGDLIGIKVLNRLRGASMDWPVNAFDAYGCLGLWNKHYWASRLGVMIRLSKWR